MAPYLRFRQWRTASVVNRLSFGLRFHACRM
jgi:hypothetical protein